MKKDLKEKIIEETLKDIAILIQEFYLTLKSGKSGYEVLHDKMKNRLEQLLSLQKQKTVEEIEKIVKEVKEVNESNNACNEILNQLKQKLNK